MIPVSTSRIKSVRNIKVPEDSGNLQHVNFAETLKQIKNQDILKSTGQDKYGQLRLLCQNNDDFSAKKLNTLIKHHELLADAKNGALPSSASYQTTTTPLPTTKTSEIATKNKQNPSFIPSEENMLIISATYNNYVLNDGLVGHGDSDHLFLPFNDMAKTLDFSIDVDDEKGIAKGWFISEERKFSLDLATMTAVVDGKKVAVPPEQIKISDNTIFVDSKLLSQWFPVDFKHNFSEQSLEIKPRETMPFQARIEREKGRKATGTSLSDKPEFPRKFSEYNLFEPPVLDVGLSSSYTKNSSNNNSSNNNLKNSYYLLSKGDLGKMTTQTYLSGDDSDLLNNARFSIEKNDPDAQLLGPLKATKIAAGDVRTPDFPIMGGGASERGITVSNQELNRSIEFDTTHFEGNLPPGWDVEVYRNKMLLDHQRVDSNGRYSFEKLPIYYGKNDFELIFYGPQGQKRVEKKQINIGNQMMKKGENQYQLSLSQKDANLYEPNNFKTKDKESFKLVSRYDYGFGENFSLGGGISSEEVNGKRHDYLNSGFKSNLKGAFITGDLIHDIEGGDAAEALVQTGFGPVDLKLKQQVFNDFTDEYGTANSDPLKSLTGVSLSGRVDEGKILPTIPFALNLNQIERESSSQQVLGGHFATTLKRTNLNSYIQWMNDNSEMNRSSGMNDNIYKPDSSSIDGYVQASSYLGKLRIRSRMDYELEPEVKIKSAEIANQFQINDKLNSELSLKTDIENDTDMQGALRFNWNNGKYNLSPEISYNTNDEFKAMMTFSTSLGMEPRSNKIDLSSSNLSDAGSVSARVFHDKNNNQIFDGNDEPIKGASVKAVQAYRKAETDDTGVAFLTGLSKYRPTDVVVDKETLEDPSWQPSAQDVSIVPRPGHSEIMEFPVITTGEIDGKILTATKDGIEKQLSNIPVQLLDSSGKVFQEVRSEYDGFYLFEKVPPGQYSIQVNPENTTKLGKTPPSPVKVAINSDGNVESGKDIFLKDPRVDVAKHDTSKLTVESKDVPVTPRYGLHLASYKSEANAVKGIEVLKRQFGSLLNDSSFTIKRVDLGAEKGIWFRLIAGNTTLEDAKNMGSAIKNKVASFRIMKIDKDDNSTIQAPSPPNNKMSNNAAVNLMVDSPSSPYLPSKKSVSNKNLESAISLQLASYKSRAKAELGIKILKKQFGDILVNQEFFIRRVDLGQPKGIVFRLAAGKFRDKQEAQSIKELLNQQGQDVRFMKLRF